MAYCTKWMKDSSKNLPSKEKIYMKAFNSIYVDHVKPTLEMCEILNITMEQALQLRKDGFATENGQETDAMSVADFGGAEKHEKISKFSDRKSTADVTIQHILSTRDKRKIRNNKSNAKKSTKKD